MSIDKTFNKLAAQEEAFFTSKFLSPVIRSIPIRVRIAGIVINMKVTRPKDFEGWGVFQPIDYKSARLSREATMKEQREYLNLFPGLRLIVCSRKDEQWYGIPANSCDNRFKITGLVPIRLPQEVQMFQTIRVVFDGVNCWYDDADSIQSPKIAVILREALAKLTESAKVDAPGLTKEERQAYNIALLREIEDTKDKHEERIKNALTRAGAEYRGYVERATTYTIEYNVEGHVHKSVISKDNLSVVSAGICLSGGDKNFDLQSLVGVIKEGMDRHRIVPVQLNQVDGNETTVEYGYERDDYDDDYDD